MPIRTILAPIDGTEAAKPVLDAAFTVGRDLMAHIDVLHVRADSKNAVPLLGEGMSGAMIEEMIDLAEKEASGRAKSARSMFESLSERHAVPVAESAPGPDGASVAWIEETGREDEVTAQRGRLADLIVIARPTPDMDVTSRMTLNAAIRETGRPVLVVPPEPPRSLGRKVAVAWNGSAEAARAVRLAMDVISRAEEVAVLTVEGERTSSARATEFAAYLAWHGITAQIRTLEFAERFAGEKLLKACGDMGADLLVMGAYTQSRVRQLILGGVTRHVLEVAELPVVMAR